MIWDAIGLIMTSSWWMATNNIAKCNVMYWLVVMILVKHRYLIDNKRSKWSQYLWLSNIYAISYNMFPNLSRSRLDNMIRPYALYINIGIYPYIVKSAVKTWSMISWYFKQYCNDSSKTQITNWSHKTPHMPRHYRRAMGCLLLGFGRK